MQLYYAWEDLSGIVDAEIICEQLLEQFALTENSTIIENCWNEDIRNRELSTKHYIAQVKKMVNDTLVLIKMYENLGDKNIWTMIELQSFEDVRDQAYQNELRYIVALENWKEAWSPLGWSEDESSGQAARNGGELRRGCRRRIGPSSCPHCGAFPSCVLFVPAFPFIFQPIYPASTQAGSRSPVSSPLFLAPSHRPPLSPVQSPPPHLPLSSRPAQHAKSQN